MCCFQPEEIVQATARLSADPDTKAAGISHGVMNVMVTSFDDDGTARTSIANRAVSDLTPENYQRVVAGGVCGLYGSGWGGQRGSLRCGGRAGCVAAEGGGGSA